MGKVQDAVSDALVAEVSGHREWDEPPAVHPLYVTGGACRLGRLQLPDAIWMTAPPAQVLAVLADCAGDYAGRLQAMAPGELHGVAFFTEIWMASARYGSAEAEDLAKLAEAAGGRVSTLPERVEARSIWAVDRAGITYTALQRRGEDEVIRDVWYPKAGQPFTGAVPRALGRMVTAFLGVTLPDRGRTL